MEKEKIRIGILGYGNLGKGVELAIKANDDMELVAIFTRRNPKEIQTVYFKNVLNISEMEKWKDKIDVLLLCGGSATDLPEQGLYYAKNFNTVDSYDTHAKIPEYFEAMDRTSKEGGKVSIISIGWDPGAFSLNRLFAEAFLPKGKTYTFWGKGVSQGHSDAIRRIKGVKNAIQYTIPVEESVEKVRRGEKPELTTKQKHLRECYVVLEENADKEKVEKEIKTMPNYFADYHTIVHFVSEKELLKNHAQLSHGGFVIRSGYTGMKEENKELIEYSLKLDSNPEFTASILVAYARAAYRLYKNKEYGAKTIFDIAPNMIINKTNNELLKELL